MSLPTLFISHGSPMLALEDEPTTRFLRGLSGQLEMPKAIVVASAHWETEAPQLTGAMELSTIHDFYGFPDALYRLRYPAKGDPLLASHIGGLLAKAGFASSLDHKRGLDHGAWNPLLLMYPKAEVPVVGLSIQPKQDARWHYKIGQALATLCDESILVIGTGNLTHNLHEAFRSQHTQTPTWVSEFAVWVEDNLAKGDLEALLDWQAQAPHARQNHPTPEHFLPFFVALGAGGFPATKLHADTVLGVLAMDAYAFGAISPRA